MKVPTKQGEPKKFVLIQRTKVIVGWADWEEIVEMSIQDGVLGRWELG